VEPRTEEMSDDGEFPEGDVGTIRKVTNQKTKNHSFKGRIRYHQNVYCSSTHVLSRGLEYVNISPFCQFKKKKHYS